MFSNQKHAFWQALIIAGFIFGIGLSLGFVLEGWRVGHVATLYSQSEVSLLDMKILADLSKIESINCSALLEANLKFADRIYEESRLLDDYDGSSRLSDGLKIQHKRYDLLRTLLWASNIQNKQACTEDPHILVYLYDYNSPSLETKAKQAVFSKYLANLKQEYGGDLLLIPIAGDNDIDSLDVLMNSYGIVNLPVIILDEDKKFSEIDELNNLSDLISGYLD